LIYLHIGRHKTGTTRLQEFLTQNQQHLAEYGFDYPILRKNEIAHHTIALYLMDPATEHDSDAASLPGAEDIRTVQAGFDATQNISIISSEGLQNIPARRARELVGSRPTKIIAYFREQASYAVSAYSQHIVGTLYAGDFNDFVSNFYQSVNYPESMSDWSGEFGLDNLRIRIYDREQMVGSDIRRDFLEMLGIDPGSSGFDFTASRDTDNVCGDLLKMKILLNRTGYDETKYRAKIVTHLRAIAREHPEMSAAPQITREGAHAIRQHYSEQNREFFANFPVENGSRFSMSNLSQKSEAPCLDRDYEVMDIPFRQAILDELVSRDAEIGDLFSTAMNNAGVRV
tara:strand:+ start:5136 stop:6164 length:1029 start_codon:yes stop_codon:yes gene_type:complete